jgi:diadenosine tetraphosphatase ApaH/serine/threonine PP2A family protein phosphatase
MGDYVDRGLHSVHTVALLLILKIKYSKNVYLLRGCNESRALTRGRDYHNDVLRHYGTSYVWSAFQTVFDYLPICALVDDRIFCVHGGLTLDESTQEAITLNTIENEDRFEKEKPDGHLVNLLWSNPNEDPDVDWTFSIRGCGYQFGKRPTQKFHHINGTDLLCSGIDSYMDGHKYMFDDTVLALFSCPNYCQRLGNKGGICEVDSDERVVKMFSESALSIELARHHHASRNVFSFW